MINDRFIVHLLRVGRTNRTGKLLDAGLLLAGCLLLSGCGSVYDQFVAGRVKDSCDNEWPVCSTTVGCILGDRSFIEGRFPGEARVSVQLLEPSQVTVSLLISETTGAGEETVFNFYEGSCSSRVRVPVSGRTLLGESETRGFTERRADLADIGDHLIEVESDARTRYTLKVDVLPLRLRDQ